MCGEDPDVFRLRKSDEGTSPHVWGRLAIYDLSVHTVWNIPTCVGKTKRRRGKRRDCREHPHMCGEDPKNLKRTQVFEF